MRSGAHHDDEGLSDTQCLEGLEPSEGTEPAVSGLETLIEEGILLEDDRYDSAHSGKGTALTFV